ncbi:DUF397 domain-containing protein [Streptomyces sp. JJ38]|uniref:DUF397 domain-containing protein n=1 Tax=Streptomyces sp. JJ38 TaxID=2738128 RepID=UPI001C5966D7|nr:DUF397 domain-containing protein [Streptomyces sp. JJ38]MBW1597882.1 DUF397 domain-containing protein [Streptomyces sp. JJ38]
MFTWRKSTHSDGSGGDCLEVLEGVPGLVAFRDSKAPARSPVVVRSDSWTSFIRSLKRRS